MTIPLWFNRRAMLRKPLPPVIRIEPASACNLRCRHCPTGVVEMPRTIMKPELFDRILSELDKHIPPVRAAVLYHGGEPFLNKNFLSMVRRVKALGMPFVKTVTNGMLLRPDMLDAIVTSGLDQIEISLDGESAAENDSVRRGGDFRRVADVVKSLAAANVRHGRPLQIMIATTQFQKRSRQHLAVDAPVPLFMQEEFADIRDEIGFKTTWAVLWPSAEPSRGYDVSQGLPPSPRTSTCSLLEETITVRADGTIVACCYDLLTQSNLGNIANQSLEEIWNGDRYESFRQAFAAGLYPDLCANCAVVTGRAYLLKKEIAAAV